MTDPHERFIYFDGLRGLAALVVAVTHFVVAFYLALYSGRPEHAHHAWEVTASSYPFLFLASGANFAVCIFLALSGFVLARSFYGSRLGLLGLLLKRTIRLGLPILAASLLGWLLLASGLMFNDDIAAITRSEWLGRHYGQAHPSFYDAVMQAGNSLVGIATVDTSYNSALWTMPIEFTGSVVLIVFFSTIVTRTSRTASGVLLVIMA